MENIIHLNSSKIWIHENDIIWQDYRLTKSLSLEDAREISEAANKLAEKTPEGKKLMLSSMANLLSMEPEVRKYFADYPSEYDWKIALVYDNSMARIFTYLLLLLVSTRFESKSFSNLETATSWLRGKD